MVDVVVALVQAVDGDLVLSGSVMATSEASVGVFAQTHAQDLEHLLLL